MFGKAEFFYFTSTVFCCIICIGVEGFRIPDNNTLGQLGTTGDEIKPLLGDFELSISPEERYDDGLNAETKDPPFWGTCFEISKDTITLSDPTSYKDIKSIGRGTRAMYDRNDDRRSKVDAFLYVASYNDQQNVEFVVHPKIGQNDAFYHSKWLAEMYGRIFLPFRSCTLEFQIVPGDHNQGAGGGTMPVPNVMFHLDYALRIHKLGYLEEVMLHEAAHACLDPYHYKTTAWKVAVEKDGRFISTYAKEHPQREDITGSSVSWFAVRGRKSRQSANIIETTETWIPNRLDYFDKYIGVTCKVNGDCAAGEVCTDGGTSISSCGCTCESFVDSKGHGNCGKVFQGKFGCYVHEPSSCKDLRISTEGRKYSWSQACEGVVTCKVNGDCASGEVCTVGGAAISSCGDPICNVDGDCNPGDECTNGGTNTAACVTCKVNGDCAAGEVCTDGGTAISSCGDPICNVDGDCNPGDECTNGGTKTAACGIEIQCSTWPTSENWGCTGDGDPWKPLDMSLDTSETSTCQTLCLEQGDDGCCFLANGYGCFWKGGARVTSSGNGISVKCHIVGYVKYSDHYCLLESSDTYRTFSEAKSKCTANPQCRMFYDYAGNGNMYILCRGDSVEKKSTFWGSNVYEKITCNVNGDCATGEVCTNGGTAISSCVTCNVNGDCAAGEVCTDGGTAISSCGDPICNVDGDCNPGDVCTNGGTNTAACGCVDKTNGHTDEDGDGCDSYLLLPELCGVYDTNQFTAYTMCCACKDTVTCTASAGCTGIEVCTNPGISSAECVNTCTSDADCANNDCNDHDNDPGTPTVCVCVDTDNGATDAEGDGCTWYSSFPEDCGGADDDDFFSNQMCCACGGGTSDSGVVENVYCHPWVKSNWTSASEATQKCSEEHSCYMFFDKCSNGNEFWYCSDAAELESSSCGSTLYYPDPCTGKICSSHGSCSVDAGDATDGYLCTCSVGYTGNDCEHDPCTGKTCSSHGSCSVDSGDTTDGYLCTCSVGYNGNDCEHDPCTGKICSSHGSCSVDAGDAIDGYLCTCSVGYTGNDCEHDPCTGKTCSSHGSCSVDSGDTTDGYLCTCTVGYNGNDCEHDPCTGKTCSSHGSCSVDSDDANDGYLCTCSVSYTGNDCEHGMCSGNFLESNISDAGNNKQRPPAGTKCVEDCVMESGRWGSSWCYTSKAKSQWGAECVQCSD